MRKTLRLCLILTLPAFLSLLLLGVAAVPATAQQGTTTGSIRGQVVSEEGEIVANAEVTAVNDATGLRRSAATDARGRYLIPLLPSGSYTVSVRALGYQALDLEGVRVVVGETSTVQVEVTPEPIAVEELRVVGERATLAVAQGGVVQTIDAQQVEDLPVLGRDFTDFLNLSPLVSPQPEITTGGQFSIAGARTSGTNIRIDGTDANNVFFGENRGSSRTPFTFSLESIREFQLITNGFDVEYGNYHGGVVNAITKGGTNEFGGAAFLFFRDQSLTRKDFAGNDPTDFRVYQFGGNLSGPLIQDRLHYFLSLDAQIKDTPIFAADPSVIGVSPDSLSRLFSVLETAHGVQNPQRWFGQFNQDEDNLVLFGRLDWSIDENHRLTFRQNYSDFEQTNDRISLDETITHGGPFEDRAWSTVVELNSVLGPRAFNTFRFQFSNEDRPRPFFEDGGALPQIEVRALSDDGFQRVRLGGDGIVFRNRLEEKKFEFINNFSVVAGDHTFKLGTSNLLFKTTNTFWLLGNGSYTFSSLENFEAGNPSTYFRLLRACPDPLQNNAAGQSVICPDPDIPFAEFTALEWNLYAQDAWQATDRLQLVGGVRLSGTTFADDPGRVPEVEQAFGIQTGVVPSFTGVSPRFTFTYDLVGDQRRVLRGGVGLLVGRAPTVLAGNVFQTERPLLEVFCAGADVPAFNFPELLASPTGLNNPFACAGGAAPTGRPEHSVFDPDFGLSKTWKANLGYEHLVARSGTRLGVDFLFSVSHDLYTVTDENLRAPVFTLGIEGRPVFVPGDRLNRFGAAVQDRAVDDSFNRIFVNRDEGEARAVNLQLEVDQRVSDVFRIGARYAHNRAFDNSSFSCCTSFEGLNGEPTAGDPNFVGDIGDSERGAWGPSRFERRHVFTGHVLLRTGAGFKLNGIWRLQSGTPWTPVVDGDINGDGLRFNDRAFVGTNLQFDRPEDLARMEQFIAEHKCLRDQVGTIATRNSCRNPWFHSLDLRAAWEIPSLGRQKAELLVDLFNVLNLLNSDWGRLMAVFTSGTNLLEMRAFDAETGNIIYRVPAGFGEERLSGFDPFQGQVQVGIRYRF